MTGSNEAAGREQLGLYRQMITIRRFEERVAVLYRDGHIPGFCHLSIGQEACAVGACAALPAGAVITSTHRGHGHLIAKGANVEAMFAELLGRETGLCRGRGGSMHVADPSIGVLGANGIVAAGLPIAVGAAVAGRILGDNRIALAFFGDGAIAQGAFHESLNLAALWNLPVIFFCENNGFAEFSPAADQHPVPITARAHAYGIDSETVDGNDVLAVRDVARAAVDRALAGGGPTLIEAVTYRWAGHYEGDPLEYRAPEDFARAQERDPIRVLGDRLGPSQARSLADIEQEVAAEIAAAATAALAAPAPEPAGLDLHVVASRPAVECADLLDDQVNYGGAIRKALSDALRDDPTVFLAGIDIGRAGGVFRVTRGLRDEFGSERVRDTPISEMGVMGAAVGAAMTGARPVVELMFDDFLGVCLDQIMNQAAKLRFMTGGAVQVPLVIRTQYGAGRSSAAQHSQSLEGLVAAIPGLTVVVPSTAPDAYGLLRTAIEDPNPVVFFENRHLYGRRGTAPGPDHRVPFGRAAVIRPGGSVTVVSWGRLLHETLQAADELAGRGIQIEVVDLRTLSPLDWPTIHESVRRTSRLAIVHEAHGPFGPGAEIAALAAEHALWELDAPIRRICPPAVPAPYAPELESVWLPDAHRIAEDLSELAVW